MSDIKWIKIATDIFDNRKIRQILKMENGDKMVIIWFRLLCLTGISNNHGLITLTDDIPYTIDMFSTEFSESETIIRQAIDVFRKYGMIGFDGNSFYVHNWEEYQNVDSMEKIREQGRERTKRWRNKKEGNVTSDASCDASCDVTSRHGDVTVTQQNKNIDIEIDIEKDEEKEREKETKRENDKDTERIVSLYNSICKSLPDVKKVSINTMRMISDRMAQYSIKDFETVFEKAEASDFLTGRDGKGFRASFDWLLKDDNMAKAINGNYDNRERKSKEQSNIDQTEAALQDWLKKAEKERATENEIPTAGN